MPDPFTDLFDWQTPPFMDGSDIHEADDQRRRRRAVA